MGAAVWFLRGKCVSLGMGRLAGFALPVLAGAAVYAVCVFLLRSAEMRMLCAAIAGKLKKKSGAEEDKAAEGGQGRD